MLFRMYAKIKYKKIYIISIDGATLFQPMIENLIKKNYAKVNTKNI